MVREEFLHFIWKYSLYSASGLRLSNGSAPKIISPGEFNRDAGPDFFNARVKIGETVWAGNIELHNSSSQWYEHGHHKDSGYDNVVLHVVVENDRETIDSMGRTVPTATLSYDDSYYSSYLKLVNSPLAIPCENDIGKVREGLTRMWVESVAVERLERKVEELLELLKVTGDDWEELFYLKLAESFGGKVNRQPFVMLARTLPMKILRRHAGDLFQTEALLFGTAGLLDEGLFRKCGNDNYFNSLATEFRALKSKYSINPMHGAIWKMSRMHPAGFPTIRIAQLADLLSRNPRLFSRICDDGPVKSLIPLFRCQASDYWDNHYLFGKEVRTAKRKMGEASIESVLINVVSPILFAYGKRRDKEMLVEASILVLDTLNPEKNRITEMWSDNGLKLNSAFMTQGLIELYSNYCKKRRCLDCLIGSNLISLGLDIARPEQTLLEP